MWIGGSSKIARTAEVLLRVQAGLFGSGSAGLGAFERHFSVELDRGVLFRSRRVPGVELPITLLDPASPFVPGNGDADMVRANPRACGGDFLLRLTRCQGKDLIAEAWRAAISASWFRRCGAPATARLCWSRRFHGCGGAIAITRPFHPRTLAVARKHSFRRLQLAELANELLALCIDARERLADPLLLFGDLVQCSHSVPSRQSRGGPVIDLSLRALALTCMPCN